MDWSNEETILLLKLYKSLGSKWVAISKSLPGRTESEVKNKFYTTLKRVATRAQMEDPVLYNSQFEKCKKNLIQFVDAAIQYNHLLPSKKGRKKNSDKVKARSQGLLFPKSLSPLRPMNQMQFIPVQSSVLPQYPCFQNMAPSPPVPQYPMTSWYPPPMYLQPFTPNLYRPIDYGVAQMQFNGYSRDYVGLRPTNYY